MRDRIADDTVRCRMRMLFAMFMRMILLLLLLISAAGSPKNLDADCFNWITGRNVRENVGDLVLKCSLLFVLFVFSNMTRELVVVVVWLLRGKQKHQRSSLVIRFQDAVDGEVVTDVVVGEETAEWRFVVGIEAQICVVETAWCVRGVGRLLPALADVVVARNLLPLLFAEIVEETKDGLPNLAELGRVTSLLLLIAVAVDFTFLILSLC